MPGSQSSPRRTPESRVFGPVPSWRLGRSLGVDLAPFKRCNWNCVYCQLGRTRPLVSRPHASPAADAVLAELRGVLDDLHPSDVDWITLLGSGEPLLCSVAGDILEGIKAESGLPVAILTNGSLLSRPDVRDWVMRADLLLPTLSAPTPQVHRALNRPHPRFPYEDHLAGLRGLRRSFPGRIWVEVMLVAGANDGEEALRVLARRLRGIAPDEIHLNQPTRPPAEPWVRPPGHRALARAAEILGEVAPVRIPPERGYGSSAEWSHRRDLRPRLLGVIRRHPMTRSELRALLGGRGGKSLDRALEALRAEGSIKTVRRLGRDFWVRGEAYFPDPSHSRPPRIFKPEPSGPRPLPDDPGTPPGEEP